MDTALETSFRTQLHDRRLELEGVIGQVGEAQDLMRLLHEVDAALKRLDAGSYGRCEVCLEDVDQPDLVANPLVQYCLCELTPERQRALEHDLGLAARVQWALLPAPLLGFDGLEARFRYEPAGPVGGDYCDLVTQEGDPRGLFFLVGDVSGKGVAASFLMARLHALFRGLIGTGLGLGELVGRVNQLLTSSTITSQYATLVCSRVGEDGAVELVNAGHCPPLLLRGEEVSPVESSGFPIGLFRGGQYRIHRLRLEPGDGLFLYTDGLTEARDKRDVEYGIERVTAALGRGHSLGSTRLLADLLADQRAFLGDVPRGDDLTLMVVRRK